VSGFVDGGFAPDDGTPSVDMLDYSVYASTVTVDLFAGTVTGMAERNGIDAYVGSGNANDVLNGPGEPGDSIAWTIDGANAGEVQGVTFSGFANLTGQGGTADSFSFTKTGSL